MDTKLSQQTRTHTRENSGRRAQRLDRQPHLVELCTWRMRNEFKAKRKIANDLGQSGEGEEAKSGVH